MVHYTLYGGAVSYSLKTSRLSCLILKLIKVRFQLMTITSYAQNFEDVMLFRALKGVKNGFYIDIGACAPDADSVTRLFYQKGWRGINIEPNPHYLDLLSEQRTDDTNLGLALSDKEGVLTFYVVGKTGLSSLDPEVAAAHASAGMPATEQSVHVSTLQNIWSEHVSPDQDVHFLKIDVEGEEAGVIRGANWTKHRPWIVVVEATAPTSQNPTHEEWEPILLSHGYHFAYWDGLNRFYVSDEHAELADAFLTPPNVFDDFVLYRQVLVERQALHLTEEIETLHANLDQERENLAQVQKSLAQVQENLAQVQENLAQERYKSSELERRLLYLKRPLLEKILFRDTGKPKRALRRALFHTNGKPRGIFRRIVLHKNGRPRKAFYEWMVSPEYQALPRAISTSRRLAPEILNQPPLNSPRTRYFLGRLGHNAPTDGS